jgi:hypothetical protein
MKTIAARIEKEIGELTLRCHAMAEPAQKKNKYPSTLADGRLARITK